MFTETEKNLITKYKDCDVNSLALKLHDTKEIRSKLVLQQIAGRQLMQKKMPLWTQNPDIIYPVHLPIEQCSSMFTADYKRKLANISKRLFITKKMQICVKLCGIISRF
jgi:hypothetical protein